MRQEVNLMSTSVRWVIGVLAFLFLGGAAFYGWQLRQRGPRPVLTTEQPAAPASRPVVVVERPAAPPPIQHPIEQAEATAASEPVAPVAPLPPLEASDSYVAHALVELLGRKDVQTFLALDSVVRHVVATVDNLPGKQVAVRIWPVPPTPGRIVIENRDDGTYVSAGNASRYEPFVHFVEAMNTRRLVALYVRLYPLFQQAYQDLGYPKGYFNDRLIAVIDHLLETPEPARLPKVTLPEVKGPIQPSRPWVMYEFEDISLDERSAGQKILLRMGAAHTKRLKAKLAELRRLVARSGVKQ
jgi:hypothetical protein